MELTQHYYKINFRIYAILLTEADTKYSCLLKHMRISEANILFMEAAKKMSVCRNQLTEVVILFTVTPKSYPSLKIYLWKRPTSLNMAEA